MRVYNEINNIKTPSELIEISILGTYNKIAISLNLTVQRDRKNHGVKYEIIFLDNSFKLKYSDQILYTFDDSIIMSDKDIKMFYEHMIVCVNMFKWYCRQTNGIMVSYMKLKE